MRTRIEDLSEDERQFVREARENQIAFVTNLRDSIETDESIPEWAYPRLKKVFEVAAVDDLSELLAFAVGTMVKQGVLRIASSGNA